MISRIVGISLFTIIKEIIFRFIKKKIFITIDSCYLFPWTSVTFKISFNYNHIKLIPIICIIIILFLFNLNSNFLKCLILFSIPALRYIYIYNNSNYTSK